MWLLSRYIFGNRPTFQDSTGGIIETTAELGALQAWFATGPALRKFEDEIRPDIFSVLQNCDLPTTQEVFLRLYMVGRTRDHVKPVVMICCVDPKIRKQGKTAVKQSGKLNDFPEYGLSSAALPLESAGIVRPCQGTSEWCDAGRRDALVYPQPHPSIVGRRLVAKAKNASTLRSATGGPIIGIGEKVYQMSVSHFLQPDESPCPSPRGMEDWDLSQCELEEDFEDDKSLGTKITSNLRPPDSVGDPRHNLDSSAPLVSQSTGRRTGSSQTTRRDTLDYALIEIDESQSALGNLFHDPTGAGRTITGSAPIPAHETSVIAVTSRGSLGGTLIPGSTGRRMVNSNHFQDVYPVMLDGEILEGDCGSAVVDPQSGRHYGHVVLGCPGTRLAYLVAATEVMQDIRTRTGADATFDFRQPPNHAGGHLVDHSSPSCRDSTSESTLRLLGGVEAAAGGLVPPSDTKFRIDELAGDIDSWEMQQLLQDTNRVESVALKPRFQLGHLDVMAIVVNKMIGTGIFNAPVAVRAYTGGSVGLSLLFWALGGVFAMLGSMVSIEFGLSIPKAMTRNGLRSAPRNGGEKNYLEYFFSQTCYRPRTWLFSTFLFAAMFLTLGNMAGNSISFGTAVVKAAGIEDAGSRLVTLVAIAGIIFCFVVNAASRRAGIWLNNLLGLVKVSLLLLIIVAGIVFSLRVRDGSGGEPANWTGDADISGIGTSSIGGGTGFATACFAIVFSYTGFDEATYVLGEIHKPHRKFPVATMAGVALVTLLYLGLNACYGLVALELEKHGIGVGEGFFEAILGQFPRSSVVGRTFFYASLALSSFGNIVVMTYTAGRVAQEIAKEGILPGSLSIARNASFSRWLLSWLQRRGSRLGEFCARRLSALASTSGSPIGGLSLHLAISIVTVLLTTWKLSPGDAYDLLSALAAYSRFLIAACLGAAFLLLSRLQQGHSWTVPRWSEPKSSPVRLNTARRFGGYWKDLGLKVFTILSANIALLPWIAGLAPRSLDLRTFQGDAQGWSLAPWLLLVPAVLGIGSIWFLGLVSWARFRERKLGEVFVVKRVPVFVDDEDERGCSGAGPLVQLHETVHMGWVARHHLGMEA